jgi:AraC family transcriptional regulator of adaptative response/methylated-DNA-[protein]-cysteine methyltransferase
MMITETHIDARRNDDQAWQQLLARDSKADFYYGVATTGVFCRPDCGSRLPLRANTRFFATPTEARVAGFRPCKRCKPEEAARPSAVAQMCALLERQIDQPVRLATLGKLVGISPFTAQRLFKQAMGVSPSQYQRSLRGTSFRSQLNSGVSVTDAIYEAGYGSSSRAYEQAPLGMTPGKFVAGGRGERIGFAVGEAAELGWLIVAGTGRGICWVALGDSSAQVEAGLRAEFPAAQITHDPALEAAIKTVLRQLAGASSETAETLPLDLRGTAFQLRVWSALQQIPAGETRSYSGLAAAMGNPAATRAVARACATNRVAVLVPCHRVVGASGSLTGYRWGVARKRQLLAAEQR